MLQNTKNEGGIKLICTYPGMLTDADKSLYNESFQCGEVGAWVQDFKRELSEKLVVLGLDKRECKECVRV